MLWAYISFLLRTVTKKFNLSIGKKKSFLLFKKKKRRRKMRRRKKRI